MKTLDFYALVFVIPLLSVYLRSHKKSNDGYFVLYLKLELLAPVHMMFCPLLVSK